MARHDPRRVLAEVAAKRQILDLHEHYPADSSDGFGCGICAWDGRNGELVADRWCKTVRLLAAPYADKPGFNPAWEVT